MKIEVRLFATFRDNRFKKDTFEYEDNFTVADILKTINIALEEVAILLVNGLDGKPEIELKDGDVLSLFPPVGGG